MELINVIGGVIAGWAWLTYGSIIGFLLIVNLLTRAAVRYITSGEQSKGLPYVDKIINKVMNDPDLGVVFLGIPFLSFIITFCVAGIGQCSPHLPASFMARYEQVVFGWAYDVGYHNAYLIIMIVAIGVVIQTLKHGYPLYKKIKHIIDNTEE